MISAWARANWMYSNASSKGIDDPDISMGGALLVPPQTLLPHHSDNYVCGLSGPNLSNYLTKLSDKKLITIKLYFVNRPADSPIQAA